MTNSSSKKMIRKEKIILADKHPAGSNYIQIDSGVEGMDRLHNDYGSA